MQSPKSPVNNAGVRSTSRVWVTPEVSVNLVVSASAACADGIIVLRTASVDTNAVVHAGKEGNRAIVEMVVY